jgi:hypothetical protein
MRCSMRWRPVTFSWRSATRSAPGADRRHGNNAVEELVDRPVRAPEVAVDIGMVGYMYHPRRLDWPSLRDPTDGWIFDLAYASGVDYIVSFDEAVRDAAAEPGFEAVLPQDLLEIPGRRYEHWNSSLRISIQHHMMWGLGLDARAGKSAILRSYTCGCMQDPGYEFPRIPYTARL